MSLYTITFDDESSDSDEPDTPQAAAPKPSAPMPIKKPRPPTTVSKTQHKARPGVSPKPAVKPKLSDSYSDSESIPMISGKPSANQLLDASSYSDSEYYSNNNSDKPPSKVTSPKVGSYPSKISPNNSPGQNPSTNTNQITNEQISPKEIPHKDLDQPTIKNSDSDSLNNQNEEIPSPTQSIFSSSSDKDKLIPYKLDRIYVRNIRGKKIHFQLYQNGTPILHAKIKQSGNDEIYITSGTETHFRENNFRGILLSSNSNTFFSLHENSIIGKELMRIKYIPGSENSPREVNVHFSNFEGQEIQFNNRKARLAAHNIWILDLHGRLAMRSIKNCVLVDEHNKEVMIVIKTDKNELSLEAPQAISDIEVMAMGISSFLCKK